MPLISSHNRGKALRLDGVNQYVALPDDPKLNITGDLTIKARVMINSLKDFNAICSKGGASANDVQWLLTVENGNARLYASNGSSLISTGFSGYNLNVGVWYDIVAGFNGADSFITVNYASYNSITISGTRSTDANSVTIGSYSKYPGQYTHNGAVDRVKIWNRALTVAEAQADNTTPNTTGLVADYQFEGNTNCSNDSSLNGTAMNGAIHYVGSTSPYSTPTQQRLIASTSPTGVQRLIEVGKNPASYRKGCLDTSNTAGQLGCVAVNLPTALNIVNAITVECWVKPTLTGGEMYAMGRWENGAAPSSTSWLFGFYLDKVVAIVRKADLSSQTLLQEGTTLASGVWHHIAFTYDGAVMRLYINGVETDYFATTGDLYIPLFAPVRLGGIGFPGFNFNGQLDNCRIWNRALSAAEILANKNLTFDTAPNLVANWKCDEPGLPLLRDSSGTDNPINLVPTVGAILKLSDNTNLV